MRHKRLIGALGALIAFTTITACSTDSGTASKNGDDSKPRIIEISMTDNKFDPDDLTIEAGEKVTFRFRNEGQLAHEATIGTAKEQDAHGDQMAQGDMDHGDMGDMGDMDHGDSGGNGTLTVEPGKVGDLTHDFSEPGKILIGCHIPGHYESGMVATINVT